MKNLVFLTLILIFKVAIAQEAPPFANVTDIQYRGTGCDAESARAAITPDLNYLSVLYDRFKVEIGTGSEAPNAKIQQKNCIIVVKMDLPPGWSFQFDQIEYRGFVNLPNAQSQAVQHISVETERGQGKNFDQNILQGPRTENFVNIYKSPVTEMNNNKIMMPNPGRGNGPIRRLRKGDLFDCSDRLQKAILRIRSRIMVRNVGDKNNSFTQMVVDSTDASFNQRLKINWNKCI